MRPANWALTSEVDAQDRMTRYGTCTYAYGANGELEQKIDTATGDTTGYQYDEFGNLREVSLPDGREITYGIDGLNRRVVKRIDGVMVQSLLYKDQLNPIAELDANGNFISIFAYGEKSHVPSLMRKGNVTYKIVSDHLGSVRQVIDTVPHSPFPAFQFSCRSLVRVKGTVVGLTAPPEMMKLMA